MDLTKLAARDAFTLIELLVVITIIAILMGLLFPAFKGVQDQAKRTQAKNDVTQVVTAVNALIPSTGNILTRPVSRMRVQTRRICLPRMTTTITSFSTSYELNRPMEQRRHTIQS